MKLPFLPVYILTQKEMNEKIERIKQETEQTAKAAEFKTNSKWMHEILVENAKLKIKYQSKF